MKVQGFELEISGEREDAALIGRNVGSQFASLLTPAIDIVEGEAPTLHDPLPAIVDGNNNRKKVRRRIRVAPTGEGDAGGAIDFKHEITKFGMPSQEWKTAQKSIWLLYVLKDGHGIGEASTRQLAETFNKHFRQSGAVKSSNVSRDLGKAKIETPSLVGEDTRTTPSKWYLTDEGVRTAQALVAQSRGGQT
jgi:hypothetical protein